MTYAVSEPVRTLLAESNRWLHVTQHVVHVRVMNSAATTTRSIARNKLITLHLYAIDGCRLGVRNTPKFCGGRSNDIRIV